MSDTLTLTRKNVLSTRSAPGRHWVGDGFPVHGLFGYSGEGVAERSPFLMRRPSSSPPRSGAAWAATRTAASRP